MTSAAPGPWFDPPVSDSAPTRADALLDAQVAFLLRDLTEERFATLAAEEIDHALDAARTLTLDEVVDRAAVQAVARKYVASFRISRGAIPELIGQVAGRLYDHPVHDEHPIGAILDEALVAPVAEKLLGPGPLRARVLEATARNPVAIRGLAWLLQRIVVDARTQAERLPGLGPLLEAGLRAVTAVAPGPTELVDAQLRELSERVARVLLREAERAGQSEDDGLVEAVLELLAEVEDEPVGRFRTLLAREDLEDLLVIAYELWMQLREHPWLLALVDEGVALFFDEYGAVPLRDLLEEIGLTREDLLEEAQRFGPRALTVLQEAGLLEAFLRRRLAPFFASDEARALLGDA